MPDELPNRERLWHDVPHWVEDGSWFFITVNCANRRWEQLTLREIAVPLLDAAKFYHEQRKWHLSLLLLMPDHLHAIMSFPRDAVMAGLFQNWKRYTTRALGIQWQDGFFDHRLRSDHEANAKHRYIRQNPVVLGLCKKPEDWPHQLRWSSAGLVIGGD